MLSTAPAVNRTHEACAPALPSQLKALMHERHATLQKPGPGGDCTGTSLILAREHLSNIGSPCPCPCPCSCPCPSQGRCLQILRLDLHLFYITVCCQWQTVEAHVPTLIHRHMQVADLVVVAGGAERARVPLCIEQAGAVGALVCDGRLVVDAAFRTNDPNIFAAGTVATFSRRSPLIASCLILLPSCCATSCGLSAAAAVHA